MKISEKQEYLDKEKDGLWLESYLHVLNAALTSKSEAIFQSQIRALINQSTVCDLFRRVPMIHKTARELLSNKNNLRSSGRYLSDFLYASEIEITSKLVDLLREIYLTQERRIEEVRLLTDITDSIISSLDMKEIFGIIATKIGRLVNFDRASIVLVDEKHDKVLAFVLVTKSDSNFREGIYPLKGTAQEWILRYRETCIDNDLRIQRFRENQGLCAEGLRSSIRIPLLIREKVLGTLNLDSREIGAYGTLERKLLEQVSGQVAIAVENSRLYEEALRRAKQISAINSSLERIVQEQTIKVRELEKKRAIRTGLIAHCLKNPIIGIRQALQMLTIENKNFDHDTLKNIIDEICSSCDLLLGIVNDMLDVYRYEFDSIPLYLEPVYVEDLMDNALWLLRHRIVEKRINICKQTGSKLLTNGDKKRLFRVFLNLLENAVKFSPLNANIGVLTSCVKMGDSNFIEITIDDEGPGIPEKDIVRVFDQFYQVQRDDIPVELGSGLGLCYCKMVVEAHDGSICAENKSGGGAVFKVTLPALEEDYIQGGGT